MKRVTTWVFVATLSLLAPQLVLAAGSKYPLESPQIDVGNERSLQRGAKTFVNYCMTCHSLAYMRYARVAEDLGIPPKLVEDNLIFAADDEGNPLKVTSMMESGMSTDYGKQAFGVAPPDLSLTARSRGEAWLYTYLKSFYVDEGRAGLGSNNAVLKGSAMPNVLWQLQGHQAPVYSDDGKELIGVELVNEGSQSPREFDKTITDLVNFLSYAAEPGQERRRAMGFWVILFMLVFSCLAWVLKKEYWRDVH
ncbi:MAG: cytochrome c1 [Pseudomonadota bacterium]